ncbi:MAG: lysyl-tRNA synthetase class 1, partial [Dinoroseobacter sp.]
MSDLRDAAMSSKAWPFEEARKLLKRFGKGAPEKGYVLFQTGYGPSGLPHIGTFGEVARTTMVRQAFEVLSDIPTKLICFSDDMDGLRKVPGNVPNQEAMAQDLNLPLTRVRDPFGTHEGFAQHNNARLREFLDGFGFDYEFASATDYYTSGRFDEMLLRALERFDKIMEIMLPTLGPDRQATYSPFLPVSPKTGHVLQVPVLERNV